MKLGVMGFAGAGKTYTSSMLALGLAKETATAAGKPVAFFDTEGGSDFIIKYFEAEKIELVTLKSSAFVDLLAVVKEAEKECSVLIVDSISHVWTELQEAFMKQRKLRFISMKHWGELKKEWARWTKAFLSAKVHIIVLGRATYEYITTVDAEGDKEMVQGGTKMSAEKQFPFEFPFLIEIERHSKGKEVGAGYMHRAHILKDRSDQFNGHVFDFEKTKHAYKPGDYKYVSKNFKPWFDFLNPEGHEHISNSDSTELFVKGVSQHDRSKRRDILLEELQAALVMIWPGQDAMSKTAKLTTIDTLFATRAWKELETRSVEELERGFNILKKIEGELSNIDGPNPEHLSVEIKTLIEKTAMQ